ncbi:ferredoxin-type protein NapG [Campylobacter coli]|uniref:ferredoxin-type protein NapG n=1 Tax=Campylobacter coli TaxID=195 RepID=UPI00069BF041|nr:ferredoxin-type protein NapG [Campylobacter coli]ECK7746950.1 ferredoxin-type protein NapG [Campylobacter coli]ECK8051306.1 ferredoxin-type protein NapG [Campylobacter coli]ECL2754642.1 ferredoxin-type protein NapG [Campylobacter coli]ECL4996834.1 ferredoxin-type protein NapG [Campylobacter coli]ECO2221913.1 ferredoxin-type protein NapG [Campylobacter coli]
MKDRREFFASAFKGLCLCTAGGFLANLSLKADDDYALRPPGAEDKARFLSKCIRCGLCVKACPYNTLKLATLLDSAKNGTPFFKAREIPCYLCKDIPCIKECPTDALDKKHLEQGIESLKMGIAIVDSASCVAHWGIQCDACYRACPLIDRALKLELKRNERTAKHAFLLPSVDHEVCVGCGLCELACITEKPAIRVLPREYVLGKAGSHYVKGWDQEDEDRIKDADTSKYFDAKKATNYLNEGEF